MQLNIIISFFITIVFNDKNICLLNSGLNKNCQLFFDDDTKYFSFFHPQPPKGGFGIVFHSNEHPAFKSPLGDLGVVLND